MNTASPKTAPRTCPDWCIDKPDTLDPDDGTGDHLHRGPRFGSLEVWATTFGDGRPLEFSIDTDGPLDYATADGLRELAHAAEEAANWLEAQLTNN